MAPLTHTVAPGAVPSSPAPASATRDVPMAELLTTAADLAEMVNGRTSQVTVCTTTSRVEVRVQHQADAEHLARLLRLDTVKDQPAAEGTSGCTVWTGRSWSGIEIAVLHPSSRNARSVRAWPERAGTTARHALTAGRAA